MVSKNENLDWEDYEAIIKYIYEALGSNYGIKIKCHSLNYKVLGKSGVSHHIDVLTEQKSEGKIPQLTAIECKYLNKKITEETVMNCIRKCRIRVSRAASSILFSQNPSITSFALIPFGFPSIA